MKSHHLFLLAVITVGLLVAAVILSTDKSDEIPEQGTRLFPKLLEQVNDISSIRIKSQTGTVTLTRGETGWQVEEKSGYPADMGELREALLGLANLIIIEPKTKNPELYKNLNLQDVDAEGSTSTLVTLTGADGEIVAELLIGKQRPAKGLPTVSDIYVRKSHDPQTWLVQGNLNLPRIPDGWINNELLHITVDRIHRIHILHPNGDALTIEKDQPTDTDFHVRHLPKGAAVESQMTVNTIARTLAQLSFDDVFPKTEKPFPQESVTTVRLNTFDGLEVTIKTAPQKNTHLLMLSAAYRPELRQEPEPNADGSTNDSKESKGTDDDDENSTEAKSEGHPVKSIADVQKEATQINARVQEWIFEIATFKANNFIKHRKDLVKNDS